MFVATLFITDKNWTRPKCPLTYECIKIVHPNNGMLLNNKKRQTDDTNNDMDESQMLSQSQAQNTIYCMIPLYDILKKCKTIGIESRLLAARD